MKKLLWLALILVQVAFAQEAQVPKHLELARELLATVKPENNRYDINGGGSLGVRWKGDFLTSENSVQTACAGLVSAVLEKADNKSYRELKRDRKGLIRLESYLDALHGGYGPKPLSSIFEVQPGDLFLFECLKHDCHAQGYLAAGHVAIVDVKPWKRQGKYSEPIIEGTIQWIVVVIDSDEYPHDITDTRYSPRGTKQRNGIGRGRFRVYTDMNGAPVGYTSGYSKRYFGAEDRKITFTRP